MNWRPSRLPAVDHRDDVRVAQLGDGAGFTPEPLDVLLVIRVAVVQDLERDVALEQSVVGAVDARHPPAADELLELVPLRDDFAHHDEEISPLALRQRRFERVFPHSSASSSSASEMTSGHEHTDAVRVDPRLEQKQPRSAAPRRSRRELGSPAPSSPDRGRARSRASRRAPGRRRSRGIAPATPPSARGSRSPIAAARSTRPSSSNTSRTASAAACATGLPTYVPPIAESAGASMISARADDGGQRQAGGDRLRDGDQVGLDARSARSRTSSRCGRSRSAPRRRRGRCRARRRCARTPWRNSGGATTNPPSPCTGSITIAATFSAATCVMSARSSARARSRVSGPR